MNKTSQFKDVAEEISRAFHIIVKTSTIKRTIEDIIRGWTPETRDPTIPYLNPNDIPPDVMKEYILEVEYKMNGGDNGLYAYQKRAILYDDIGILK